jgi:hypothetical protein
VSAAGHTPRVRLDLAALPGALAVGPARLAASLAL